MRTLTIDILNVKAERLIEDLEEINLIKVHKHTNKGASDQIDWKKYKGAMSKQPIEEIDSQLHELRSEWEWQKKIRIS